jgi:hypothetical protein
MYRKSISMLQMPGVMPIILATWEARIRTKQIIHEIPSSKITGAKWTRGMAQAVQHLLYKYKALSSNSSSTKKKKKAQAMKQRETNKKWQKSNFITNKLATDI